MTRDDVMRETVKHVRRVGSFMLNAISELQDRAIHHDDSKFSSEEFDLFAEETPKLRELTYNSPEYKEALTRLGPALAHHYASNRHHPEHFKDGIYNMTLIDLIEMLADWAAASERHANGDLGTSIIQNAKRFGYDYRFALLLANTAHSLNWMVWNDSFNSEEAFNKHLTSKLNEPVLCYIDSYNGAYFTTQNLSDQWGDDWNDAPYECNAGPPNDPHTQDENWKIIKVMFESDWVTPSFGFLNSPYSVESINAGAIAWLRPMSGSLKEGIMSGTKLSDFIRIVQENGGKVYTQLENKQL